MPIVNEIQLKTESPEIVLSLENLIKSHVKSISELSLELKNNREMYNDSFDGNPTFREHSEKVKEATKARSVIKQQIAKQPSVSLLEQKLKDIRFDLKEQKKTLSDLLLDYRQKTQATQLELFDGQLVDIVESAKIVKSSQRRA